MILQLLTLIGAGLAGALAHEGAHWLVWRLSGRDPTLHPWKLVVRPRAGPAFTTATDRVAAAAPYVLGVAVGGWGVIAGNWPAIFFGVFAFQIPSQSDVTTMLGRAEWVMAP